MVQVAWLLYDADGNELAANNHIIYPENYTIPSRVAKVHGITTARAKAEGVDLKMVLEQFAADLQQVKTVVAHNISFDEKIIGAEMIRKAVPHDWHTKKQFCTMKSTTHICKLPGRYGYKWPTLDELYRYTFQNTFKEQHNALADIRATAACFWELRKRGLLKD